MSDPVLIFGKDACPYTTSAREDYAGRKTPFRYVNVLADPAGMEQMLRHSGGKRQVPVIVDGETVTIGFGGT